MKTHCNFSLEHYRDILECAARGFTITNFANHETVGARHKPTIILRHDLDSGLSMAVEMAFLEYELNISTTYFVQLHSDYYPTVSHAGSRYLQRLTEFGHEVGLHYDPTYYQEMGWEFRTGIQQDLDMLSNIIGREVVSVSRHLPLLQNQKIEYPAQVRYDAYDPKFINGQFRYLSDSNGIFREGCFCQHLKNRQDYCFLVHPIWWVNKGADWIEKLQYQIHKDCERVKERIEEKITQYKRIISNRQRYDSKFENRYKQKRNLK